MLRTKILLIIAGFLTPLALMSAGVVHADPVGEFKTGVNAAAGNNGCTDSAGKSESCQASLNDKVDTIVNILSSVVGVIAVIMIIVAGFRYVTSGGSEQAVSSAKKTILYAAIGLVVVAMAQVIVRYVLKIST